MAGKQFKTYCKIIDYVDSVDADLAALLRGTCADMPLNSFKGKPGITFLMPQDKAFRAKLEKLAYSDKTEEASKAGDMLNACIIRDVFKTAAEWKSREVANSLYPSQVVEVDSVSAKEVTFKSGAKAVLDEGFKDSSRRSNIAVWKLVSGEIPVTTDKPAQSRMRPKGKVGAYDAGVLHSQSERFKIALAVENAYALCRLQHHTSGTPQKCAYLDHTLSLINFIMHVRNDTATLYEKILPLISLDKIDFYLLVEPHKMNGPHLLDDALIHEWWSQKHNHTFCCAKVIEEINVLLTGGSGALVYTDRNACLDKIADLRQKLSQMAEARPRNCVDEIAKHYAELESNNSIEGLAGIYPAPLAQYYASEPGLKMIQDELRYLTYGAFKRLESSFDFGAFNELTNMIGECLHAAAPDDRSRQHKLLNKNTIKYMISPAENVQEIKTFMYSTMFMYIPLTCDEAANLKFKHSIRRPDPSSIVVFNIAKDLYIQHNRVINPKMPAADLIAALRELKLETLDPALRVEIQKKFSA